MKLRWQLQKHVGGGPLWYVDMKDPTKHAKRTWNLDEMPEWVWKFFDRVNGSRRWR